MPFSALVGFSASTPSDMNSSRHLCYGGKFIQEMNSLSIIISFTSSKLIIKTGLSTSTSYKPQASVSLKLTLILEENLKLRETWVTSNFDRGAAPTVADCISKPKQAVARTSCSAPYLTGHRKSQSQQSNKRIWRFVPFPRALAPAALVCNP